MGRSDLLNITQIAAALGVGTASASRCAARGDYSKPVVLKGTRRKLYRVEAVEAAIGKTLAPEKISIAKATRDYAGPNRSDLLVDFASAILALRDRQHLEHVHAQGFANYVPLPPFNSKG